MCEIQVVPDTCDTPTRVGDKLVVPQDCAVSDVTIAAMKAETTKQVVACVHV